MTRDNYTVESTKSPGDDESSPITSAYSQKTTIETTAPGRITQSKTDQASATKDSDIGIAVGVLIATFITVATVVVGVILIRRGKVPCMCCRISLHDKSSKCTMNTSLVNNSNTIPLDCPNRKVGEVVPQTNIVSEDDVQENNGHLPHDYFILEKTEADRNTTVVQDEVNVYNTLASNVKQEANFDNTYDTAEKAAMKLKTKHRVKDDSDANETLEDEDPYNHLNEGERQLKTVRTDNVYGVTQDDEYANCRKTHGKYLQDVEDTYNHTNILQDAEAVEDTYNHTNISKDVEDDTYNHTSPVS
ncbi:uncharacterized protein LOC132737474 [Ruditapes philippinarum]|uniref:uncharacterized protein LOC132737474 n=1 Tax=Ruditapes philippinarum TaxID=129788 RepID=UPI00295BE689|nr:uncharacterized protein LOC132737474 [Ruditapes philippinarum]